MRNAKCWITKNINEKYNVTIIIVKLDVELLSISIM